MWPGASSVPESMLPSITEDAPQTRARKMSLSSLIPPSAMMGTESPTAHQASRMAWSWGTPAAVSRRVRHPRPGPIPTLMPSAPRSFRNSAPAAVPTFPHTSSTSGNRARNLSTACRMTSEWAWAMSMTRTSAPALTSSAARSKKSPRAPMAAPTRNRPLPSLVESGRWRARMMSLLVMRPRIWPRSSTRGSFSMRRSNIRRSASSTPISGEPVMSLASGVMNSSTRRPSLIGRHGMSRLESRPARTLLPRVSSIRMPVMLCFWVNSRASRMVASRGRQSGRSTT